MRSTSEIGISVEPGMPWGWIMDIFLCIYMDMDESALKLGGGGPFEPILGPIGDLGLRPLILIGHGNLQGELSQGTW